MSASRNETIIRNSNARRDYVEREQQQAHAQFEMAVEAVLPRLRFAPAEVGGQAVRQLVQMPFVFSLGR